MANEDWKSRALAAESALASAQARIAELEAMSRIVLDTASEADTDSFEVEQRALAAESALASARARLALLEPVLVAAHAVARDFDEGEMRNLLLERMANVVDVALGEAEDAPTPAPSEPVAVTEARELLEASFYGSADIVRRVRAWLSAHPMPEAEKGRQT